jgi:putative NIF3 family GTP cyclohydrolase 1 type 2
MNKHDFSRRALLAAGTALAGQRFSQAQDARRPLRAGAVIDRIKAALGVPWREQTVDRIIAGTPETAVRGIATTMMATLDVIQRAAAIGKNMVVTHEPTFYSHQDTNDQLTEDPTYRFKLDFCDKHDVVVFRFHDHWHAHRPDGIAFGMAKELGWDGHADPENIRLFAFPTAAPLSRFAKEMQTKLKIRTVRVVGDPSLPVRRAIASWGYVSQFPGIPLLARPDIDVLIVGEAREWELVEYAQDTIASGKKKALIVLGHVVSEQAGMKYCAEWLKPVIPEIPIEFVAAGEPFWSPDHPVA